MIDELFQLAALRRLSCSPRLADGMLLFELILGVDFIGVTILVKFCPIR